MVGARLTFEERKSILKWYIKFENVDEVQRQWKREFHSAFSDKSDVCSIMLETALPLRGSSNGIIFVTMLFIRSEVFRGPD
jgi:hypothetical protein